MKKKYVANKFVLVDERELGCALNDRQVCSLATTKKR